MSARRRLPIAWLSLPVAAGLGALLWHAARPVGSGRPGVTAGAEQSAQPRLPPRTGGQTVVARESLGPALAPDRVAAIDPDREPQQWVEAVETFRARLDHFARDPSLDRAQRRTEGEELLRLVDAFATKNFYLPGQPSQVKLEIARQIYGDEPELMDELAREYETDTLREMQRFRERQERERLDDPRFQSFKAQEAGLIERMRGSMAPGPERDAAIAQAVADLHRQIFAGPSGP
jgi:hypothetical protein